MSTPSKISFEGGLIMKSIQTIAIYFHYNGYLNKEKFVLPTATFTFHDLLLTNVTHVVLQKSVKLCGKYLLRY